MNNYNKAYFLPLLILLNIVTSEFVQAQDWANLSQYTESNKTYKESSLNPNGIVFFGNSITQGWPQLSPKFFENPLFINRGIGGQTTPQMLIRFRQDVVDLKPKSVIILAGTNDIAGNTGPATNKQIIDNIKSMCEIAVTNNIEVMICSILPVYDYPWKPGLNPAQRIIDINTELKTIAKEMGLTYVDYFSKMVNQQKGLNDKYTHDGVHPNTNGYKMMEEILSPFLTTQN